MNLVCKMVHLATLVILVLLLSQATCRQSALLTPTSTGRYLCPVLVTFGVCALTGLGWWPRPEIVYEKPPRAVSYLSGNQIASIVSSVSLVASVSSLSFEFLRQVVKKDADVLPPEARAHARSSAPLVMNTPRRRNEDGDSTSAWGCRPRRSVTNHHGHASRSGSLAHEGTVHPSLRARYSAIAANAASTRLSPVPLGASDHIRAAACVPAWCRTLV